MSDPPPGRRRAALGLAILSLALAGSAAAQRDGAFTADERARLLGYELVQRNVSRTEGRDRLFGGTSWQRVDAPVEDVWAVVSDPTRYDRLIPSLEEVRVIEDDGETRILRMTHRASFVTADYYARMRLEPDAHRIRFELDESRPHQVRAGRGFLELSPYRGGTIVSWGMLADVGAGVLQQAFGPFLNQWLLKPPRCVRDEVEPGRENTC